MAPKKTDESISEHVLKVTFPSSLWEVFEQFARSMHLSVAQAVGLFIRHVELQVRAGNYAVLGELIGSEANKIAGSEKSRGIVSVDSKLLSKLEKSPRTKSGYAGVYANGKGFLAVYHGLTLGTYPTSERAALERKLHCERNRLPYGEIEAEWGVALEQLKKLSRDPICPETYGREPTTEEILDFVNSLRDAAFKPRIRLAKDGSYEEISSESSSQAQPGNRWEKGDSHDPGKYDLVPILDDDGTGSIDDIDDGDESIEK